MGHFHIRGSGARRAAACLIFAGAWCLSTASVAQDFDFYAMDLITQESYRKISMDLRDASLKDILKIFSEQSGLNFIASDSIKDRTMTLFLDQVPLNDALKKIMQANNLTYEMEAGSNIFIVKETGRPDLEVVTRVYPLRYARVAGSRLQASIDAGGSAASGTSTAEGSGTSAEAGAAETDSAGGGSTGGGLESALRQVMTSSGLLVADPRTNCLIVTDVQAQFPIIEKVLRLLDSPVPQVMIEVEMLDVSKGTIDQLGVNTSASLLTLTGSAVDTRFPNFMADKILPANMLSSVGSDAPPGFQYGKLSAETFTAVLDFLRTDSQTKFLARPRILTMSNESAEIKITTNEAIGKIKETNGEGSASSSTETAERYETGVSLKVTPQVDSYSGSVTMYIEPIVSQAKASSITINGDPVKDPETRSSKTTLMVKDGETIVVGGLIRTNSEKTVNKMPVLGDLPLVGMLFRHKSQSSTETELLVFITPRIVGYDNVSALARSTTAVPLGLSRPFREQTTSGTRKREVDSYLEQWEN